MKRRGIEKKEAARCPDVGKLQYASEAIADEAARDHERDHQDGAMSSYRCAYCRRWHIGHVEKKLQAVAEVRRLSKERP